MKGDDQEKVTSFCYHKKGVGLPLLRCHIKNRITVFKSIGPQATMGKSQHHTLNWCHMFDWHFQKGSEPPTTPAVCLMGSKLISSIEPIEFHLGDITSIHTVSVVTTSGHFTNVSYKKIK